MSMENSNETNIFNIHYGPVLPCQFCHMSFISELFLNKHLQKCMNQKIYSHLKLHFIIFKKAPSLDNNKTKTVKKRRKCEDKTQKQSNRCDICSYKVKNKDDLLIHKKIHFDKPYSCDVCLKTFLLIGSLRVHFRIHSQQRPYRCKLCSYSANQSKSLKNHVVKFHINKDIYTCDKCLLQFSKEKHYNAHCVLHTIRNDIQPKQRPNDHSFKYRSKMENRKTIYECTKCAKEFDVYDALIRHYSKKHADPKYACSICFKEFIEFDRLSIHFRVHTKEKPYKCRYCPKECANKGNLNKHIKIHEKKEKEKVEGL